MIFRHKLIIIVLFICLVFGFGAILRAEKPNERIHLRRCRAWSVGVITGSSPLVLSPAGGTNNPVLTADDVTDVTADYIADPFLIRGKSAWYMFFEVMNDRTARGEIGVAKSQNGVNWNYKKIVLAEPFHLSYPYVFTYGKHYYMIPESKADKSVRLYYATRFPTRWKYIKTLVKGNFTDPSIFRCKDKWWMFVCQYNNTTRLFYADKLTGPWVEHPESPIVRKDPTKARGAGRVMVYGNKMIRLAQNCKPAYGSQVRAFEITKLSTTSYAEKELPESPVLTGSGSGWNRMGMHQLDAHQIGTNKWMASVDGW